MKTVWQNINRHRKDLQKNVNLCDEGIENILYAFKLALGEEKWDYLLNCASELFISFTLSYSR